MTQGLAISRLINVAVNLTPNAAQFANFDSLLIMGSSNVINVSERIRSYASLLEVAADFGSTTPEYLSAELFFSQVPQPNQLYIGRWAQSATAGLLVGGPLTSAQKVLSNWTAITTGAFKIAVDGGGLATVSALDFSSAVNLNGVAAIIQAGVQALGGAYAAVTCTWDGSEFTFTSGTTGASSAVAPLQSPASGTDISAQLLCTSATLSQDVAGIVAETPLAAVIIMDGLRTQWYGLTFAVSPVLSNSDLLTIAAYIEAGGTNNPHLFGVTTQESAALTDTDSTSIGYLLKAAGYNRSFAQWSENAYAVASMFGRGCTVDFAGNNTTITFMYKIEPGVVAEDLTSSQANALDANNYNYFANFNINKAIIVNGKCASGQFIDTVWGVDWLANQIQVDVFNLLYTSTTKIPQTDAGVHLIVNTVEAACAAGVNNGLLAPGVWNTAGFGQLVQGGFLSKGYYVYAPSVNSQAPADRAARKCPPIQVAAKLAGAIHTVNITVNVNQ